MTNQVMEYPVNVITEALMIARDNFDFDGEYEKSDLISQLLIELSDSDDSIDDPIPYTLTDLGKAALS